MPVSAAKSSPQAKGEADVVLGSLLRSESAIASYLDQGKIKAGEVTHFKHSVRSYHDRLPEFVKTAAADRHNYSISAGQEEQLAAKAQRVHAALSGIFVHLEAW